jgi:hypothetical protein
VSSAKNINDLEEFVIIWGGALKNYFLAFEPEFSNFGTQLWITVFV